MSCGPPDVPAGFILTVYENCIEGNGDGSGRRYPLQWFEKGRLEYHAELAGTRYAVELGLLGVEALQQQRLA